MKFGIFGGGKIGKGNPLGNSYAYQDFFPYVIDAGGIQGLFTQRIKAH